MLIKPVLLQAPELALPAPSCPARIHMLKKCLQGANDAQGAHKYYITIESCSRGREHKPNRSTVTACDCPGDGNLKVKQGRAVFLTSNCLHWQVASVAVMKNTILKNPQA